MLRELMDNPRLNYEVVGFLDDDPQKRGRNIHGVSILGDTSEIQEISQKKAVEEILIAIPSASTSQMRRIVALCEATGQTVKTTPGIGELIDGRVSFKMIRDVSYEDLLGREQVTIDTKGIGQYLKDKVVLVTGAGGSIGSQLCREVSFLVPEILFSLIELRIIYSILKWNSAKNFLMCP